MGEIANLMSTPVKSNRTPLRQGVNAKLMGEIANLSSTPVKSNRTPPNKVLLEMCSLKIIVLHVSFIYRQTPPPPIIVSQSCRPLPMPVDNHIE